MEDNHDEEDDKLLVYCKRESDEHAGEEEYISGDYTRERAHIPMQKDAELEDGHSDDLCDDGVGERIACVVQRARGARVEPVQGLFGVPRLVDVDIAELREVRRSPRFRSRGVGGERCRGAVAVRVRVVGDAGFREDGGAPAEGYELDDEDEEYADETDRHRVGL